MQRAAIEPDDFANVVDNIPHETALVAMGIASTLRQLSYSLNSEYPINNPYSNPREKIPLKTPLRSSDPKPYTVNPRILNPKPLL